MKAPRKTYPYKGIDFASELERRQAKAFDAEGVEWIYQYIVPDDGGKYYYPQNNRYRWDFYLPQRRMLVECQGYSFGRGYGHNSIGKLDSTCKKLNYAAERSIPVPQSHNQTGGRVNGKLPAATPQEIARIAAHRGVDK